MDDFVFKEPTQEQKHKLAKALEKKFHDMTLEEFKALTAGWTEFIIKINQSLKKGK